MARYCGPHDLSRKLPPSLLLASAPVILDVTRLPQGGGAARHFDALFATVRDIFEREARR